MRLALLALAPLVAAPLALPANAGCPTQRLIYQENGTTYVSVPDPVHRCESITVAIPVGNTATASDVPPPCPPRLPVYVTADETNTYVHVRDPLTYCSYITVAVPVTVPPSFGAAQASAFPYPCEPQPILQTNSTGTYLVVRDPTQPCAYIRIPVPVQVQH